MWGSDYRIRLHLSRNDSHSNEAERTNSAIADSLVNGQTIEWEFRKLFHGISANKIEAMTLQEFERYQDERMKLNAYMVRDEFVKRIDGASCLKEEIVAYPSPDDPYCFKSKWGSKSSRYFLFSEDYRSYIQKHYHVGQLHMHFLKDQCDESGSGSCSICSKGWIEERFNGIPETMPDHQRPPKNHYKSVFDTTLYDDNNKTRETDDFLRRPNIASAFNAGHLSVDKKSR